MMAPMVSFLLVVLVILCAHRRHSSSSTGRHVLWRRVSKPSLHFGADVWTHQNCSESALLSSSRSPVVDIYDGAVLIVVLLALQNNAVSYEEEGE